MRCERRYSLNCVSHDRETVIRLTDIVHYIAYVIYGICGLLVCAHSLQHIADMLHYIVCGSDVCVCVCVLYFVKDVTVQ